MFLCTKQSKVHLQSKAKTLVRQLSSTNSKQRFPVFQSHLDFAHCLWRGFLRPGDVVVDATCGNGGDTLALAKLVLAPESMCGAVFGIDSQEAAVSNTRQRLVREFGVGVVAAAAAALEVTATEVQEVDRTHVVLGCHSRIAELVPLNRARLVVYNLGYLPAGGNKALTTTAGTTLASIRACVETLPHGGAVCVTCYPGHPAGAVEARAVSEYAATLDPFDWQVTHQTWINRHDSAPSVLLLQNNARARVGRDEVAGSGAGAGEM